MTVMWGKKDNLHHPRKEIYETRWQSQGLCWHKLFVAGPGFIHYRNNSRHLNQSGPDSPNLNLNIMRSENLTSHHSPATVGHQRSVVLMFDDVKSKSVFPPPPPLTSSVQYKRMSLSSWPVILFNTRRPQYKYIEYWVLIIKLRYGRQSAPC